MGNVYYIGIWFAVRNFLNLNDWCSQLVLEADWCQGRLPARGSHWRCSHIHMEKTCSTRSIESAELMCEEDAEGCNNIFER